MKGLWEKIISDWHQVFIVGILGLLLFGGLYLQSTIHNSHVQRLDIMHDFQVEFYKSEHKKIQENSNKLFEIYSKEKAQSDFKGDLIGEQNKLIQDLLKRIQEYKKWDSVDPNFIT